MLILFKFSNLPMPTWPSLVVYYPIWKIKNYMDCYLMELTLVILPLLSSATSNSILDRAIDSEESQHKDFLRLVRQITIVFMRIFLDNLAGFWYLVLHYLKGTCWRVSWAVCKNKDFLFYCSCKMGCWFLCQSGWWCPCQFRYMLSQESGFSSFLCFLSIVSFTTFLYFPKRNLYSNICWCLGVLASTLARYRSKPRVYMGCMKSGPVLSRK